MVFRYFNAAGGKMKNSVLYCFAVCLLFSGYAFCDVWLKGWEYRAQITCSTQKDTAPVEHSALIKVYCPAKDDGSDIRITDENGKEVAFFLVQAGPGNKYEISFPISEKTYYIFWGNPDAKKTKYDYRPKRGLLLEVYTRHGDKADTVDDCKKILEDSVQEKYLVGRTFRKMIWDGINPVTATNYLVRVYTGYFYSFQKETIVFGTTSTGPSLIFVDDKHVASWPGWHWIEAFVRPEHSGSIELEPGLHKIVYYHLERPGLIYAIGAMKKQEEQQFKIIPEDFFLPLSEGKITDIRKLNQQITSLFEWKNINYLKREKWELLTFQFTDTSTSKNNIVSYQWDFGDGQKSNQKNPSHTYLIKKTYDVKLTTTDNSGNSDTILMKVKAEQDYSVLVIPPKYYKEYIDEFAGFDLRTLPEEELFALADIFNSYNVVEKEFECYNELKNRNLEQSQWIKVAYIAADLAEKTKKYSEAEQIYKKIISEKNLPNAKLNLAFLYLETGDIEKAEQIFNLLSSDNQVELQIRRSATIGLGDAARYKADIKNASKFYESVMLDTQIERKTGVYSQQVLFYLKKNDFSTAIEKLTLWADEIPTAKIKGNWSILFARAHILKKDYEKAMKEIETFLKISSSIDNPYYGWAVYLKGEIYLDEGEKEKARETFEKVMETFSATQIANMAKEKLKEMEK